jgi:hypothetical protein
MEIGEIWYGRYAICDKRSFIIVNYLHSLMGTGYWLKFVMCDGGNDIAHATLRIQPNLT